MKAATSISLSMSRVAHATGQWADVQMTAGARRTPAGCARMDSTAAGWQSCGVDPADPILRWLLHALPTHCTVAGGAIGEPGPSPYPEEEAAIVQAVARRRDEFRAGRIQARQALARLGVAAAAIAKGAAGEPIWPAGFTGSISHTDDCAFAVVASTAAVRAIGLDVEADAPLDGPTRKFVCRPGEAEAVPALTKDDIDPAKRILVAKEAFMKLNYALTGTLVDFLDIHIALGDSEADEQAFRATPFLAAGAAASTGYEGCLGWSSGRIAAVMYVCPAGNL